jgi:putative SOS response-associated peptidase YedK
MCNLYSMTKNVDAIRRLFGAMNSQVGNLPSLPGIFPDYPAGGREIVMARWGYAHVASRTDGSHEEAGRKLQAKGATVDFKELLRLEPDSGVTNIRNTSSKHWQRWLGPKNRCLVPFTSFSEYDTTDGKPLLASAGIWTNWTCVRKTKEGEIAADVYGFLTCQPNAEVRKVYPKAMPVILTTAEGTMSGCTHHRTRPRRCSDPCRTDRFGSLRQAKKRMLR